MVLIAVSGSATRFLPAERGTVHLTIALEHDDRAAVLREVSELHGRFVADAKSFVHAGTATWWGSDQVRVRPERRYLKDSETYTWVQVAAAEVRVKFRDFDALSAWVERAGTETGVSIAGIEWAVTQKRRTEVQREVRVEAVLDAMQRAEAYASAIGSSGITLQALWEPGLRPNAGATDQGGYVTRAMAASGNYSSMELRPDDIEISAAISADFTTEVPG
ncbi:MAG: uncharacterized protein QOE37_1485 [Microbacteriaceae bacterium]|nr:uncharacterized protein [Microbacteriaceae bacterium]